MFAVQSPEAAESLNDVKRKYILQFLSSANQKLNIWSGRRGSTVLNPKSYVKQEIWKQAPILIGSTQFEPLVDSKNILVTGGAGFMYGMRVSYVTELLTYRQRMLVCSTFGPHIPTLQCRLI